MSKAMDVTYTKRCYHCSPLISSQLAWFWAWFDYPKKKFLGWNEFQHFLRDLMTQDWNHISPVLNVVSPQNSESKSVMFPWETDNTWKNKTREIQVLHLHPTSKHILHLNQTTKLYFVPPSIVLFLFQNILQPHLCQQHGCFSIISPDLAISQLMGPLS